MRFEWEIYFSFRGKPCGIETSYNYALSVYPVEGTETILKLTVSEVLTRLFFQTLNESYANF